jgi:hypothetical protein
MRSNGRTDARKEEGKEVRMEGREEEKKEGRKKRRKEGHFISELRYFRASL